MSEADRVHSTPPTTIESLSERLRRFGLRIENRDRGFALLSGNRILLAKGPTGAPATLADIAQTTARLQ
jgi:hypothetical protein